MELGKFPVVNKEAFPTLIGPQGNTFMLENSTKI